jgi:NAD(P)-dependent dehydrogenase (short-subunit alcohol dehydrogenase family)
MTARLEGKVALVTGSTSNIGRGVAIAMAAEGASVVVTGRDSSRGADVVKAIQAAGGRAAFVAADLDGTAARSAQLAADAAGAFGPVTVLVNNAGIYPHDGTLATQEDTFDRVFAVNVKAPFFLTAAVIPAMVQAGGGVIINLGSWIARLAVPAAAVYGATKGALETLTRTWAAEFGAQGIRVNALSPGVVFDDPSDVPAAGAAAMLTSPVGKPGTPADIAAAAVYLATDEAAFVHGAVVDIDGGRGNVFTTAR